MFFASRTLLTPGENLPEPWPASLVGARVNRVVVTTQPAGVRPAFVRRRLTGSRPRTSIAFAAASDPVVLDTNFVVHDLRVVKNVTVTMNDEVARWVRVEAAKQGVSVSRLLGAYLESLMAAESEYDAARNDFISRGASRLRKRGQPLPSRDQLHDR